MSLIKAHRLLFENLIDINPRMGTIKIGQRRMTLTSVEALGILRRDLVSTLGMDRAKGFLMRYGWACGKNDGEVIEKMYHWDSKKELLLAGPSLHTLEGAVTVEADILEFDDHHLYFSGYWKNSFEAEEHIEYFNLSDEPVCWMLMGYASGYLTQTFGRKIIVYESSCQGKGDDYCYFVAQPVEEYSDQYHQLLSYYDTNSLITELDEAYKQTQQLNESIIHANHVQKKLSQLLLEGHDLSQLIDVISDELNRSVVIKQSSSDEPIVPHFKNDRDSIIYKKWCQHKTQVVENKNIESFNIQGAKAVLGNMIIIGNNKLSHENRMMIERSLSICAIQIYYEQTINQTIWNQKEQALEELLSEDYKEETLKRKFEIFNINAHRKNRVVLIKVNPLNKTESIIYYIQSKYPRDSSIDMFMSGRYIVIILSVENHVYDVDKTLYDLQNLVKTSFYDVNTYISAGRISQNFDQIGKSYKDAMRICDFLHLVYPTYDTYATFEQTEPIVLFLKNMDQKELVDFYYETLGSLIEYDFDSEASLVITLKKYLDNNGNLNQTAKELYLSIPGLRYRLEKIESLCEIDLNAGHNRYKCHMAIDIYFTLQIIDQHTAFDKKHDSK